MSKTRIAIVTAAVAATIAAVLAFGVQARGKNDHVHWKTARVTRTDLRATVTATGTLQPVVTSGVGAQVSGIVRQKGVLRRSSRHAQCRSSPAETSLAGTEIVRPLCARSHALT